MVLQMNMGLGQISQMKTQIFNIFYYFELKECNVFYQANTFQDNQGKGGDGGERDERVDGPVGEALVGPAKTLTSVPRPSASTTACG